MNARKTILTLTLLLAAAFAPATGLAQNFFFIHVPPTSSGTTVDQVVAGLQEIGQILEDNWKLGHPDGDSPRICWVGYAGAWDAGGSTEPNLAGAAANALGNASATDNQEGTAVTIDYCAITEVLEDMLAECDIVIALGEGSETAFSLEEHGSTDPPEPDCAGNLPDGPVCTGEGCTGTDWDDQSYCLCIELTFSELVVCSYEAAHEDDPPGSYIPVKPSSDAGNFLCGFACCGGHHKH